MKTTTSLLVTGLLLLALASCEKIKQEVKKTCNDANTCFSIDSLNKQLKQRLDGNCIGYAYVINVKGNVLTFNSGGKGRLQQDAPEKALTVYDKMNPASLSKTVTGIAMIHCLDKHGISVEDSIYKYLPSDWTFGNLAKTITFRNLLEHRSGIRGTMYWVRYTDLKDMMAAGVKQTDKNVASYDNSNFGIMRVLIPVIEGYELTTAEPAITETYGKLLQQYINENVASKANVKDLSSKPAGGTEQVYCYQFPDKGAKGGDFGDFISNNGQAGFQMSAMEYNTIMRNAFYTENIISAARAQEMRDNGWGFDYWMMGNTPFFNVGYVQKTGMFPGSNNPGEFQGTFAMFDNNVSVTVYVNSQLDYAGGLGQLVIDAFDNSRKF